jgi:predicted MFS family arabinose efflux permease
VGLVTLASVALLLRLYPASSAERLPSTRSSESKARNWLAAAYLPVLQTPTARAVLGSSFAMSIGTMAFQTYLGAFFITHYGISTGDLAPILAIGGLGVLVGSQAGGRLGERIGHRPIMAGSVLVAALFVIIQMQTTTSVQVAAVLNFLTWVPMGMRFTSASTIISEAVPTARGTMNAVNAAFFNAGMVVGAFLGGVIVESAGYEPLGLLMLASAAMSALLVALFVAEKSTEEPDIRGMAG